MEKAVRVRIAPSPTGYFHVGSARTALFNWLFARHHAGRFIVRVEDTDRTRYNPEAVPDLTASLRWLGLEWDEGPEVGGDCGPYFQSERLHLYERYTSQLLREGHAYRCYCSPERLAAMREEQRKNKQDVGYDRHCRHLTADQRAAYEAQGITPVVRFKAPVEGQTSFHDELYGTIVVENGTLDDFVLLKSDGYPTYHMANVVDDHLMKISHIMRGDEWLPSVPKHVLLYDALGWQLPVYAHLPLILAPTGKGKLSKRHGGVEVRDFRRQGYLPEAMVNYLARLGWSYDDKTEIFSRDELVRYFGLDGINNSPARFSYDRLEWMNAHYIRHMETTDLAGRLVPFLAAAGYAVTPGDLLPMVPLVQERLKTLAEAVDWLDFFFEDHIDYETSLLIGKKMTAAESYQALLQARQVLATLPTFEAGPIETALRDLANGLELKVGQLLGMIRIAVSGKKVAPPLFETLAILGQKRTLARLDQGLGALAPMQ
ncbi:MAG: glutamate--tRNA ligase [Anaerolineae bacterium]